MALFYDRDFQSSRRSPYDSRYRTGAYDRQFGNPVGGYSAHRPDRGYDSRWRTANGDPFGDRDAGTPMRVIRGPYHSGGRGYDRDQRPGARPVHGGIPVGYDPYTEPPSAGGGMWRRGEYDRGFRGRDRGYDTGWF